MGLVTEAHEWTVLDVPAAATQATVSRAADAGGRHICKSITVTIAAAATASGIVIAILRDGPTSTGTELWSGALSVPANGSGDITISGLNITGSKNTAMTIEFTAAGAADTQQTVAISGYTCKENYVGV